ncbi:DUF6233 domain-containing protein [Streptomyces sp. NPDC052051]|uniref:DUF6233 domain-containing protein n=1 Tax=Streptomyces sp. NPDC052051 TaxID=3154649 RepID=UPI00341CD5A4
MANLEPQASTGYVVEKAIRKHHPLGATIHLADCTAPQRETRRLSANDARQGRRVLPGLRALHTGQNAGADG